MSPFRDLKPENILLTSEGTQSLSGREYCFFFCCCCCCCWIGGLWVTSEELQFNEIVAVSGACCVPQCFFFFFWLCFFAMLWWFREMWSWNWQKKNQQRACKRDDITKHSNAWQRGKLVLNKDSDLYKSMLGERSLTGIEALYSFVERSERFWQLLHSSVHRISKDIGDRTNVGPFFSRSTISRHAFVWDTVFV